MDGMEVTIVQTEREFDTALAWRVVGQIIRKANSVIGLATGNTTVGAYRIVSDIYQRYPFDTSRVTVFGLDEIVMVPKELPGTCYNRLLEQIVEPLHIPLENFIMPPTEADDYEYECALFEKRIKERGKVDLQILGIGIDGHVGMNLPGAPLEQQVWLTELSGELQARLRRNNNFPESKQLAGITLGMKMIMQMDRLVLAAKGRQKAEIINQAINGPITGDVPASLLQLHPNCEVLLDAEAAGLLKAV